MSSAAFAGGVGPERKAIVDNTVNLSTGDKELTSPALTPPDVIHKDLADLKQMPTPVKTPPQGTAPDTTTCDFISYWDPATAFDFSWDVNDGSAIAMRFDIPNEYYAEVYGSMMWIWDIIDGDGLGVPDVVISVYDDAGGIPGNLLYQESWNTGAITYGVNHGYYYFPFATPVQITGSNYHIAWSCSGGDPTDEVLYDSDDGGYVAMGGTATGTGRGSIYDPVDLVWYSNIANWGGAVDPNYDIYADYCIFYSDCFWADGLAGGTGYVGLWINPDPDWASGRLLNGFAARFVSEGPDTVKTVRVQHLIPAWFFGDLVGYDATSTNTFEVSIWPDDGMGNIDMVAGPLATETYPGGLANLFPVTGNIDIGIPWENLYVDFTSHNLVVIGPWHASIKMTSDDQSTGFVLLGLNSIASNPGMTGASVNFMDVPGVLQWERTGLSVGWLDEGGGEEQGALVRVELCRDEFYICENQALNMTGAQYFWAFGETGWAQRVKGAPINRVEKVGFYYYDIAGDGLAQAVVNIHADGGAAGPGALIASYPVPSPVFYSGWTEVVIPGGIQVLGDFYVAIMYDFSAGGNASCITEDRTGIRVNGGAWYQYGGTWYSIFEEDGYYDNLIAEVYFCSVPVTEFVCVPGDDWSTVAHDFARTGHSMDAIGDAWCDLNLNWQWEHPTLGVITSGPIIWDDYVVQAFSSAVSGGYYIFDLVSGALLDQIDVSAFPNAIGGNIRCIPTIVDVYIDDGGTPVQKPVLFVAGGTAAAVSAYDMTTVGGPIVQVWEATPANTGGGFELMNSIRYGNFIVLDDGSQEVFYFSDDAGWIYAANAADGLPYAGWAGNGYKVQMIGNTLRSGATDGNNLYFSLFTTGVEGDVVALYAFSGDLVWSLAAGDGLQADDLYGVEEYIPGTETFNSGVSYYDGELYCSSNSTSANVNNAYEGCFYRLASLDGSVLSTDFSQRTLTTHPIVDAARVFLLTTYTWGADFGVLGGSVLAYSRFTGQLDYATTPPTIAGAAWENWIRFEGVMSCEPDGRPDILMGFSGGTSGDLGYLSFFDAETGEELFNRRIDHGAANNQGASGAMGVDSYGEVHVVFADAWGTLYDLTKGADRPRLEILKWTDAVAVPFGSPYDTLITFEEVYTNSGCTEDLIVTLVADEAANTTTPGGAPGFSTVREGFAALTEGMADQMTLGSSPFKKPAYRSVPAIDFETWVDPRADAGRSTVNSAALGVPIFLIESSPGDVFEPAGGGFVTAPGDLADITVHVNGPEVSRGPHPFFVEFAAHNDPDYFFNDNTRMPQVTLTLVGGCLMDTTRLYFGVGAANEQIVVNSARMGTGDWGVNLSIDGYVAGNYQGFYAYGVSQRRLALNSQDWWTGGGEVNGWWSIQPDPNIIDESCKPALVPDQLLGEIWDAATSAYVEVRGDVIYKGYVDSVQNFDDGAGGWDWDLLKEAPFDNDSTMGLQAVTKTFGAVDMLVPEYALLNNVHVEIIQFHERNGNAVPGWKFGGFFDHDFYSDWNPDGFDTTFIDRDVSAAWVTDGANPAGAQMGFIKLPFGPGFEPIKNVTPLERQQCVTSADRIYFDSLFFYWSQPPGQTYGHDMDGADDQDAAYCYIEHDFEENGTLKFAIATFTVDGIANTAVADEKVADLAILVNKWVGFGRGDVNDDGKVCLSDIICLAEYVNLIGPGPYPFKHLGDVDGDGDIDAADVQYMVDYYFNYGPGPIGDWTIDGLS
ncbi:MAG TPA: dockerin type I domain-containing protein [Acidobacteriota bacterium]|nr:dockerin type I domain-containing protein [Acidobacteriota bacterium]